MHNLQPDEQERAKDLISKQVNRVPMNPAEKEELANYKETMRPAVPYDKQHPGHDSLTPQEQDRLATFNKKIAAGVDLPDKDVAEHNKIKDALNNPVALDESHPGWNNLIPQEKRRFKNYRGKEDDLENLEPEEEADFDALKDIIKNGRPIDENHPGFDNLNPEQQQRFRDLFKLKGDGKILTPDEKEEMGNLEDIIVHGVPIDEDHPGFKGLDPYQKKRFKNLKNLRDDH